LIIYSPSVSARNEVINTIQSCTNDDVSLSALGLMFLDYYICPFKKYVGSDSSSSPFCETEEEMLAEIKEAPKDHYEARRQALIRDGYRCLATRVYDGRGMLDPDIIFDEEAIGYVFTECAHIVPDSAYFQVSANSSVKRDYSASVLAVLKQFGYDIDKLNGDKVHSLFNVMTLQADAYNMFNSLELWFEKTATENCYKICTSRPFVWPLPDEVTFTTTNPALPLPSPQLLASHAACAQVAYLSGAREYIDKCFEEMEEMDMLASEWQG